MLTESEKLDTLIHLSIELGQSKDLDILMEHILTEARRFVNADAGSIYLKDFETLIFAYTQNDTLQRKLPPNEKLAYVNFTIPIDENSIAGFVGKTGRILNIEDVRKLPSTVPYCFNRSFDERVGYSTQSVLTVPLNTAEGERIGVLQIINAQDQHGKVVPFLPEEEPMLMHFANTAAVALERAQLTRNIILRTIKMAEMRDPLETGAHVNRVASYAIEMYERWARRRGVEGKELTKNRDIFRMAAMLHDVGKVAISDTILKKPAKLTVEEFNIMKQHTIQGARLFLEGLSEFDRVAAAVALNHHERWDGKGYPGHVNYRTGLPLEGYENPDGQPRGKSREEIPIFGRIVAVADVYDALTSARVYKEAWDETKVLKIFEEGAGSQFDPDIVEIFFSCLEFIHFIQQRYPDNRAENL
ncbi:MAG TPA: HD domain-containing phosphohydrolase [Thermodesulfovibrionales bacterium]|nr:HD domain-containing phosphohydrolase [Thermodesulfovibrionales bacterium]